METVHEIAMDLKTLLEDKPYLTLTDDLIKSYIEESIEGLIKEVKEELEKY